jgi:DNA repair protein RecN (Recombination protein N)
MLSHLRISGFALLDDVELELGPGMNVLTGETGAGKSLLVDAVALVRGGRASAEVVRAGAEEARIEALFLPPEGDSGRALAERMARTGIEPTEEGPPESLVIRRIIGRNGRGRVYINDVLSTAATLREVVGSLIDLAGQHEHQTLMDPARHLDILDAHGVDAGLREEMAAAHERLSAAAAALAAASLDERARAEKEDFLRFQLQELDEAQLEDGEDEALKRERERLRGAERLHAVARHGEEALYGRESGGEAGWRRAIVEELGTLGRELGEAARLDPALGEIGRQIEEARTVLEDAADALRRYADATHADPERLQQIEDRLHLIGRLVRKHGGTVATTLARQAAIRAELEGLVRHEERRAAATRALDEARKVAAHKAAALSAARRHAAEVLSGRVSAALSELSMAGARLIVAVSDRLVRDGDDNALTLEGHRLLATGWDRAEFLLAANPGEEPRPLARIASGGELSRIMLALKRVLARSDLVDSYVFDEVDAGIGGAVADVVGRLLQSVSATKQVLCVTHLPQIAAYGDAHFHVEKRTSGGRTATIVRRLEGRTRVEELARMVGGAQVTAKARAHAEELIERARRTR